jgi:hypothetical protein
VSELFDAFPKDPSLESAPNPMRLLPKKLQTLIMVYQAGVESGLIQPKEQSDEETTEPHTQAATGDGLPGSE